MEMVFTLLPLLPLKETRLRILMSQADDVMSQFLTVDPNL